MKRNNLLLLSVLVLMATPALAQLEGTDTAPGESCSGFPAGASRVTADADQDGKNITLICDGSTWESAASETSLAGDCDDGDVIVFDSASNGFRCAEPNPCDPDENPTPGTICQNGSIYAGISPDGNEPMYTTPADAPSLIAWGSRGTTRGTTSVTAGETNTTTLAAFGASAHPAAHYCDSLSAHGSDDWYLPAKDELAVLYTNKAAIGAFGTDHYLSSSETSSVTSWSQQFSDGYQASNRGKQHPSPLRCVRR